jgi:RimJ/RimL family protein N-acetyltransferase
MDDSTLKALGRLHAIPPREVWPHEALQFTPWLLENADVLSETREMTPAEARAWYEQQQARGADPSRRCWAIEAEGHLVGGAGLDALKETDRKAHFVIGMLAPSHMGRGLGTEATRLVLDHGFGSMNLHRVDL